MIQPKPRFQFIILFAFSLLPFFLFSQDFTDVKNANPIVFSGNLEARSMFYNASGIINRREPFSYLLSGNPNLSLYGWNVPVSFAFSKEQKSFRQPFNQFGMSPTYKWVTLHAGYRNLSFSPYTLGGHTMLGAGFELKPKKLRVGFMYGRLNRATVIDTLTHSLVPFSFSRKGYAAKLGYGTDANFFDLSFLRAKDDSTSRPGMRLPDSINVLAASNAVIGFKSRFTILKKFYLEGDGAVSLYTDDINSPIQLDSLDNGFLEKLKNTFDINGSSKYYTAYTVGAGYKERFYGIKATYKRIDPGFKTMGAYYFSNDLEAWTINPNFSLPSGLLRGNFSVGVQKDNVKGQKEAQNRRFIGSANLSAQFNKQLGMDVIYTNFSNNQTPKTLSFGDSLKIVQTTQVLSMMPRYMIVKNNLNHMIMLSANISGMKDFNSFYGDESSGRDLSTKQFFANYTLAIPQKRVSVFTNINYSIIDRGIAEDSYRGLSLGGNYALPKNKAQFGMNTSLMQGVSEAIGKSLIINASLTANYQVMKGQTIRALFFLTNNNPGSAITNLNPTFTETRGEIAYQLTF